MYHILKVVLGFLIILLVQHSYTQEVLATDSLKEETSKRKFNDLEKFPKPYYWANDMEKIYSKPQLLTLNSLLRDFQKQTKIQLKLITVDSLYASKYSFAEILNHFAGNDSLLKQANFDDLNSRDKYFGIVMFVSKYDRRIKVFSTSSYYAIGEILSDTDADEIVKEEMFSLFREHKYYQATLNGLRVIMAKINNNLKEVEEKQ